MIIEEIILEYKNKIEHELISIYKKGPKLLLEPINHVLSGKGKKIRPLLTLLTAKTLNYDINKAMNAAVSIEILHNFTLVHDDIMDRDLVRHGRETDYSKWDIGMGVLTGDALLALALDKIQSYNNLTIIKCLNKSLIDVSG